MTVRRQTGQVQHGGERPKPTHNNVLINGCFRVWQRGETITAATAFLNSNDNYCADRWCLLSDGNDIADVSRETTTVPDDFNSAIKFDVETINKKFGIVQVIEARNCAHIIGEKVNLSFYARTNTGPEVENIRAAVIAWDGAADAVTSDVVATWENEGTNPGLAANWTYESTATNLALTTTYQRFTVENIEIDTSGTTNVGVFIWVDDTDCALTDDLYITGVQLEKNDGGRGLKPFVHRPIGEELALCQRYFEKTFEDGVTPAQNLGEGNGGEITVTCMVEDGWEAIWGFRVAKFAVPSIVTYSPGDASNDWWDEDENAALGESVLQINGWGCTITDAYSGGTTTLGDIMAISATAEAEL
jgi:hypothetical protein